MKLSCEDNRVFDDPTPEVIEQELHDLGKPGTAFVILDRDDGFMQASADAGQNCDLEYSLESSEHMRCTNDALSVDEIISTFKAFAAGDDSWIKRFEWIPLDQLPGLEPVDPTPWENQKRGCLSVVLLAVGVVALLILSRLA